MPRKKPLPVLLRPDQREWLDQVRSQDQSAAAVVRALIDEAMKKSSRAKVGK